MPIGKLAEMVTSNFDILGAKSAIAQHLPLDQLAEHLPLDRLAEFGIDPALLEGLSTAEVTTLLTEAGIDPNAFDGLDVHEIVSQLAEFTQK